MPIRVLSATVVLCGLFVACSDRRGQPEGELNAPPAVVFRAYLERDLQRFFSKRHGTSVGVKFELLRQEPTQAGIPYPKYYAWVRVENGASLVDEGAVRVAAVDQTQFYINDFVPSAEIAKGASSCCRTFAGVPARGRSRGPTKRLSSTEWVSVCRCRPPAALSCLPPSG
jgi:hypothetical protein